MLDLGEGIVGLQGSGLVEGRVVRGMVEQGRRRVGTGKGRFWLGRR